MFWILVIVTFAYVLLLLFLFKGWRNMPETRLIDCNQQFFVSVVIAARNEEKNLPVLIESLKQQQYQADQFEIIIVDDHSEDNSIELLSSKALNFKNLHYLRLTSGFSGKKAALALGISVAKSDLIVTTDADCSMGPHWLKSVVECYLEHKPKLIIGPVLFKTNGNGLFQKLQALEFISLVASGAGAAGLQRPIMCNGANLAFEKQLYNQEKKSMHQELPSGDDVFLLLAAKKNGKQKIIFLKNRHALVYTNPEEKLSAYLSQRKRWASKSKFYRDPEIIGVAAIIGAFNIGILVALCYSMVEIKYIYFFTILYFIKFLTDFPLMKSFSEIFANTRLMQYFWLAELLYPFYMVFMIFYSNLGSYRWKNRKYRLTTI